MPTHYEARVLCASVPKYYAENICGKQAAGERGKRVHLQQVFSDWEGAGIFKARAQTVKEQAKLGQSSVAFANHWCEQDAMVQAGENLIS